MGGGQIPQCLNGLGKTLIYGVVLSILLFEAKTEEAYSFQTLLRLVPVFNFLFLMPMPDRVFQLEPGVQRAGKVRLAKFVNLEGLSK